ncbi:putative acyl-CoA synthetase family member 2, mitochondrial-like [Apostichopus japonicus]|uniref:Medium-chain acyl-CoA ligase ACSF2, mitochondrial n=1 Tax=Stichopus japonicus TaxID=307972 RepID=A0A2G8KNY3_STIJA|nr:putative acyl-CoA synthetase family member 2, mitochondrial-like [Apostichopus japonicus]
MGWGKEVGPRVGEGVKWLDSLPDSQDSNIPVKTVIGGQLEYSNTKSLNRNRKNTQLEESYYHSTSNIPLLGKTIGRMLDETVAKYPDRTAYVFPKDDKRRTFRQLQDEVDRLAAGFLSLGLKKGDRVGMWGPNTLEWILTQYATAKVGLIMVNMNPGYRTSELEYALKKVGVKAIVSAQSFKTQDYYSMIHEICPEIAEATPGHHLKSKNLPELESVIMLGSGNFKGALMFDDVMDLARDEHRKEAAEIAKTLQFDDPINIQFTSGTTGFPKGATLSHQNILNNSNFVGFGIKYHEKHHTICCPVPLYHCFGMVLASMCVVTHGATCVFPSPSFEPEPTLQAVEKEKCTSLYGTPTMFIDMLNHANFKNYDVSSLSTGIMAGSPCPVEIMKQCISKMNMHDVMIAYGLTEPVRNQFTCLGDPVELTTSTVGKALDHVQVLSISSNLHIYCFSSTVFKHARTLLVPPVESHRPHGRQHRTGEYPGELCISGYCVMRGYWNDDAKTREAIDEEGWFHSGDLARMDENGYCRIVGRIKDLIIRGGENVYPTEIEQFLYKHPKIEDVQVIGLPDKRMGEEVCACIKVKAGETVTPEEIKDFCKGQIAHFKIPRYIEFVEEYPMTVTLKIQKYLMRQELTKKLNLSS